MDENEIQDDDRWDWLTTKPGPLWNWWTATLTVAVICVIGFGVCR